MNNIASIAAEMQQEERDAELRVLVKELFEKYLNRVEESSSGKLFSPVVISNCRVLTVEPLNKLMERIRILSGATEHPLHIAQRIERTV